MTKNTDPAGLSSSLPTREQIAKAIYGHLDMAYGMEDALDMADAVLALLSQPTPTAEPPRIEDIGDRARAMIRWAEDYTGNAGLCYARCKEHDWRSRKRNVNNQYADPQNVRNLTFGEAVDHLRKKHKEYRIDPSTIRDVTPPTNG